MADKYSISLDEQETYIGYMRTDAYAKICTSDTTQITRLDKLCRLNPDMYQFEGEDGAYKRYICMDKNMISFRSKKREVSEDQRKAASERLQKYRDAKNA